MSIRPRCVECGDAARICDYESAFVARQGHNYVTIFKHDTLGVMGKAIDEIADYTHFLSDVGKDSDFCAFR